MNKMLVICMVFLALAIPASAANTVSIGDHVLSSGETKKVPVMLTDATDVFAINVTLSFNSDVVNVTSAEAGSFSNYFPVKIDNDTILIYAFGQIANNIPVGLNGSQIIGYVNLKAESCNTSNLDLKLNQLLTAADADITANATTDSGSVTVSGCVTETPQPTVTETPQPNVTETPQPNVTETPQPNVTETPQPNVTVTVPPETRRVVEIIDNMSGVPIINESTMNILAEDFMNFNPGDKYNITISRVTGGTVEYSASGTLLGLPKETIPVNWTPQTQGAYILRSDANTTTEARIVQVINQKVISPIPELSTIALVSAGLLGLIGFSRRRNNS